MNVDNKLKRYMVVMSLNGDASDVIDRFEADVDKKRTSLDGEGRTVYNRYSIPEGLSIIHGDAYNGLVFDGNADDSMLNKLKGAPIDFVISKADNTIYFNSENGFSKEYEGNIQLTGPKTIPELVDFAMKGNFDNLAEDNKIFFYGSDISDIPYGEGRKVVPFATTKGHFKTDMVKHAEENGGYASNIGGTSGLNDVLARTMEMINFDKRPDYSNRTVL